VGEARPRLRPQVPGHHLVARLPRPARRRSGRAPYPRRLRLHTRAQAGTHGRLRLLGGEHRAAAAAAAHGHPLPQREPAPGPGRVRLARRRAGRPGDRVAGRGDHLGGRPAPERRDARPRLPLRRQQGPALRLGRDWRSSAWPGSRPSGARRRVAAGTTGRRRPLGEPASLHREDVDRRRPAGRHEPVGCSPRPTRAEGRRRDSGVATPPRRPWLHEDTHAAARLGRRGRTRGLPVLASGQNGGPIDPHSASAPVRTADGRSRGPWLHAALAPRGAGSHAALAPRGAGSHAALAPRGAASTRRCLHAALAPMRRWLHAAP